MFELALVQRGRGVPAKSVPSIRYRDEHAQSLSLSDLGHCVIAKFRVSTLPVLTRRGETWACLSRAMGPYGWINEGSEWIS
jgi:hypothetical protein